MKTISNREFIANPEMYLNMAREQDEVRVMKGHEIYHLVYEASVPQQPILEPDDKLRNSITCEELLRRFDERLEKKWAERRK